MSGYLKERLKPDEVMVRVTHSENRTSFHAACPNCGITVTLYQSRHGLSRKSDACAHFSGAYDAGCHGVSLLFKTDERII